MKTRKKTAVIALLLFAFQQSSICQVKQGDTEKQTVGPLVLEDGTPIKLRIGRTVSSADAHVGETVDFEVLEEVRVGGLLLIPKGGVAWATVTAAESKKRMARGGKLGMNIDSVRLVDSEKVALRAVKEGKGGGHTGAMTGAIVATAIVFWPAAPFFLFMHGKDITVPKGTEITAYINGDFRFDAQKLERRAQLQGVEASMKPKASEPTHSEAEAKLAIGSEPPGAEIELDGNFVGNTPSTIGVGPGEHTLGISKHGYTKWDRKIRTSSGNVDVMAVLTPISDHSAQPNSPTALAPAPASLLQNQSSPAQPSESASSVVPRSPVSVEAAPSSGIAEESCLGVWFRGNPTIRHDGVEIAGVQPGGPAEGLGLKPGDRILAIDRHFIYTIDELRGELVKHGAGDQVLVRYQHNEAVLDNVLILVGN